jgi:arylsulfatase A-like enzyme
MKALAKSGLEKNTIVVFTSDNGGERFADTWPFTGKKTELLEGGLRIPCILRWPGHVPAGRTSDQVAISMDWLPTLLAASGTQPDAAYPSDGMNLLPLAAKPAPRRLYWRYRFNGQRAVRDGNLKFLKIAENTFLFDVVKDPLERANLKDRMPAEFERLSRLWDEWNQTMLPEDPSSTADVMYADQVADHYGVKRAPR